MNEFKAIFDVQKFARKVQDDLKNNGVRTSDIDIVVRQNEDSDKNRVFIRLNLNHLFTCEHIEAEVNHEVPPDYELWLQDTVSFCKKHIMYETMCSLRHESNKWSHKKKVSSLEDIRRQTYEFGESFRWRDEKIKIRFFMTQKFEHILNEDTGMSEWHTIEAISNGSLFGYPVKRIPDNMLRDWDNEKHRALLWVYARGQYRSGVMELEYQAERY